MTEEQTLTLSQLIRDLPNELTGSLQSFTVSCCGDTANVAFLFEKLPDPCEFIITKLGQAWNRNS